MKISNSFLYAMWFVVLLFGAFFVGGGCAATNIASFIDPEYRSHIFKKVLVLAPFSDLQYRQRMETDLCEAFRWYNIVAIKGSDLFPPTREWSEQEKLDQIKKNQIDSYLVIHVTGAGYIEHYIPPTTTTHTSGNVSIIGNTGSYRETSSTTEGGGYNISTPWANYEAKLLDSENGKTAWLCSASTGGNALANDATLISSFAYKTASALDDSKLFIKAK